jgi:hypothetical protein
MKSEAWALRPFRQGLAGRRRAEGMPAVCQGSLAGGRRSRHDLDIIEAEEGSSFLWFASIQGIEGKQDPADLAPKGCFIAAEAIECEIGQIGQP